MAPQPKRSQQEIAADKAYDEWLKLRRAHDKRDLNAKRRASYQWPTLEQEEAMDEIGDNDVKW